MLVCVVGSGGREHALARTLARSADVVVSGGNPGIEGSDPRPATEIDADLYVIGPEVPLVEVLADRVDESHPWRPKVTEFGDSRATQS